MWNNDIKITRCYGYVRVSTTMQAEEGISLDSQKAKIKAWCELNDYNLIKIYADEGVSGRSMDKRTALNEVLDVIKSGEALIVYSFSRLSRSVQDFLKITTLLQDKGAQLVIYKEKFDTTTAHGRFTATMFAALAQLESDITSERVKDAMNHKKNKGEFIGRPPYGWKLSGGKGSDLVTIQEEQEIIKKIKDLRQNKKINGKQMSYQKIANKLNDENIPPPKSSKEWHQSLIRRICNRNNVIIKGNGRKA